MIRKLVYLSLFLAALLISACGVVVTPAWEAQPTAVSVLPTQEELISLAGGGAVLPTVPPTATLVLPTATLVLPTATATLVPTVAPTVAAVEPTMVMDASTSEDPLAVLVSLYDPAEGETLFHTNQPLTGYACSDCHFTDSEQTKIGPGLLNISEHGAHHVEGLGAESYIYQSIVDPGAYVAPGFTDGLMPRNWHDVYTDDQIYAIIAYLLTLNG